MVLTMAGILDSALALIFIAVMALAPIFTIRLAPTLTACWILGGALRCGGIALMRAIAIGRFFNGDESRAHHTTIDDAWGILRHSVC
jgi:lysylphosphatidylglycerol synthetase-like protein (DUF2156 family)